MRRSKQKQSGETHLVAEAGDRRSLCGVKDPLPVVMVKFAPMHAYPQRRCSACYFAAGLERLLDA